MLYHSNQKCICYGYIMNIVNKQWKRMQDKTSNSLIYDFISGLVSRSSNLVTWGLCNYKLGSFKLISARVPEHSTDSSQIFILVRVMGSHMCAAEKSETSPYWLLPAQAVSQTSSAAAPTGRTWTSTYQNITKELWRTDQQYYADPNNSDYSVELTQQMFTLTL